MDNNHGVAAEDTFHVINHFRLIYPKSSLMSLEATGGPVQCSMSLDHVARCDMNISKFSVDKNYEVVQDNKLLADSVILIQMS